MGWTSEAIVAGLPAAREEGEALLDRARKGDEQAFAQLVRLHQDRVFDLLLRMLRDRAEAEDLAQEVFLAFHRALPGFRGESRISTWLFRIAKNHCLNRMKFRARRAADRHVALEDAGEAAAPAAQPDRPDAALERRLRAERVQAAIAALPEDQRLVVILREIEGCSYEEVAEILEQPLGTVKSRLHRARLALAKSLAGEVEENTK